MRYGGNNKTQTSPKALPTDYSIASAKQLNGKELSQRYPDADCHPDHPVTFVPNRCGSQTHESMWDRSRWYQFCLGTTLMSLTQVDFRWSKVTLKNARCLPWNHHCTKLYRWSAWNLTTKKNCGFLSYCAAQDASEAEAEYTGVIGLFKNQDVVKESPVDWRGYETQPTGVEATALSLLESDQAHQTGIIVNDHMTLALAPSNCGFNAIGTKLLKTVLTVLFLCQMPSSSFARGKKSPKQGLKRSSSGWISRWPINWSGW